MMHLAVRLCPRRHVILLGIRGEHPVNPELVYLHVRQIGSNLRHHRLLGRLVFYVVYLARFNSWKGWPVQGEVISEPASAAGVDKEAGAGANFVLLMIDLDAVDRRPARVPDR